MEATTTQADEPVPSFVRSTDFLVGILELGRNWALAVAIAGAGLAVHRTEVVTGPPSLSNFIFYVCEIVALVWVYLSIERFIAVAFPDLPNRKGWWRRSTKRERARTLFIYAITYAMAYPSGMGMILLLAHLADNNRIVQICSDAKSANNAIIGSYDECKRLYKQRLEFIERLEGKQVHQD